MLLVVCLSSGTCYFLPLALCSVFNSLSHRLGSANSGEASCLATVARTLSGRDGMMIYMKQMTAVTPDSQCSERRHNHQHQNDEPFLKVLLGPVGRVVPNQQKPA
jgi:hypothetical protein